MRDRRGQALVEAVWLLPLAATVIGALLSAGMWLAARSAADSAVHAAAIAVLERGEPLEAAKRALPGWGRPILRFRSEGSRLRASVANGVVPEPLRSLVEADAVIVTGVPGR